MQAIVRDSYGKAHTLQLREVDVPLPADDEVLIRVKAAGVDRGVWHLMTGLPYPVRLAGYGLRVPKNGQLGMDVAGVVESIGKDVTRFAPGDEVFGIGKGTFATYATAREAKLARIPAGTSFEQASALGVSALTALQGLRDHAKVQPGQNVLIIGASGGVGSFAVQLAVAFGVNVTGVASTTKLDFVRSLGAAQVIDYTAEDFSTGSSRYDVILDIGGNSSLKRLRRALTPQGTLVIVGGETGGRWLGGFDRQLRALVVTRFVSQNLTMFICNENHKDLIVLSELVTAGKLSPAIDRSYPLKDAASAIDRVADGLARGKVVLTP